MTVNEVIKHIIPVLEGIKVPMTEVETIGIPVSNVISDLKQCVAFMDSVEEQAAREEAEQEAARAAAEQEETEPEEAEPEEAEKAGEDDDERPDV